MVGWKRIWRRLCESYDESGVRECGGNKNNE